MRAEFSGHPHVSVTPLEDRIPAEKYRVEFRLRGLTLYGDQPDYRSVHHVELTLPRGYPREKPYCVPVEPVFHPNIKDYFCIADYWAAGMSLVEVIKQLGRMIQWQEFNVMSPLDPIAANWAVQQQQAGQDIFPIGKVDLGVADFAIEIKQQPTIGSLAPLEEAAEEAAVDEDDFVVLLRN